MYTLYQVRSIQGNIEFLVVTDLGKDWVLQSAKSTWLTDFEILQEVTEYQLAPAFDVFNLEEDRFYVLD